jgi:3-hydroxyisobutyrate dehydrogenase-like beta-hydroxyacid dehydrogenase
MNSAPSLAFVGFGEAAYHFARGLSRAGITSLAAWDIHTGTPGLGQKIVKRAAAAGVRLVGSSAELASAADIILSTVTAGQALVAAAETAPFLRARHLYADMNSVAPATKQTIAGVIEATGARFVEVAIMGPVPPQGHRVPLLAGGPHAEAFIELLAPFGIHAEAVSLDIGTASATKMFRSIVVKGLEAILTECLLGASRYGADRRVLASLQETFPGMDWIHLANYMVGRVVEHGERRACEMEEVALTLTSLGIEPIMASATARRMHWSKDIGLKTLFPGTPPAAYRDVMKAVEALTGPQPLP